MYYITFCIKILSGQNVHLNIADGIRDWFRKLGLHRCTEQCTQVYKVEAYI